MSSSGKPAGLLSRIPARARTGMFMGALVVALIALFTPGAPGAVLIVAIVVTLIFIMSRTWAVAAPRTRAIRLVILAVFVGLALNKLMH